MTAREVPLRLPPCTITHIIQIHQIIRPTRARSLQSPHVPRARFRGSYRAYPQHPHHVSCARSRHSHRVALARALDTHITSRARSQRPIPTTVFSSRARVLESLIEPWASAPEKHTAFHAHALATHLTPRARPLQPVTVPHAQGDGSARASDMRVPGRDRADDYSARALEFCRARAWRCSLEATSDVAPGHGRKCDPGGSID